MISTERQSSLYVEAEADIAERFSADLPVRILVVDDVEANLELFRLFLSREKAEIFLASGGEDALAQYDSQKPDCLFLDLRMPGMDGIEVAMEIRRREVREGKRAFIAGMSGGEFP